MSYQALHSSDPIRSSRILIVDDSEFSRVLLQKTFENNGFHDLMCVADGKEAIEKMGTFKPQLIVLDLMMPHMNGYEFCERARKLHELRNVPILVQTGVDSADERNDIFRLGATDLITKPINAEELMARVLVHLEKQHLLANLVKYHARMEKELIHAKKMQEDLLPTLSEVEQFRADYNVDIVSLFEPTSEMGGDMWGFTPLSQHSFALFMSDITGHGITAALNAFRLHTLMEEILLPYGNNPGAYVSALASRLALFFGKSQFASMFYGIIDVHKSLLHYATAATPHPIIIRKNSRIEQLDGSGFPLGLHDTDYHTQITPFDAGDMLILYSDAFTETPWKEGKFLSEEAIILYLADALKNGLPRRASTVRDLLVDYFKTYAELPTRDDLTLSIYHRL